ncbi:MAG: zinc transporter ZupT [Deltaproteobacteria bacterium]|nr:zinc transporter ZupT [Deltaproteobacteria bacterium]
MSDRVLVAFALTLLAGLSTGVGSALAVFWRRVNRTLLALSLGFSAGVMIYVSFVEILHDARTALGRSLGEPRGSWATAGAFFGGILLIAVIDRLVASEENPHEPRLPEPDARRAGTPPTGDERGAVPGAPGAPQTRVGPDRRMMRLGLVTAAAITLHNLPEGLATFAAALASPAIGVSIAVAIAIHNVPEGISIAVPIHAATGSRSKAFWLSFLSGLAEPLGALVGYGLLRTAVSEHTLGLLLAATAGIMVFVSLDELLPAAREYGKGHLAIYGLLGGMAVMALSLLLLR